MKTCKTIPYTHEEAERAGGLKPSNIKFTDLIYQGKTKMADYQQEEMENWSRLINEKFIFTVPYIFFVA